jgi:hypothetical protein
MYWGALLVSVTESAQVEQRCGRVSAPCLKPAQHVVAEVEGVQVVAAQVEFESKVS